MPKKEQTEGKGIVTRFVCSLSGADYLPITNLPCFDLHCFCVKAAILVEAGLGFTLVSQESSELHNSDITESPDPSS